MKAMILAAGKGTRVQPLTYALPKPMIPLMGKPVMAYLVEHLARHGVREIMVNVAHLHEKIEDYFGDGQQFGVEIGYSFEGYSTSDGRVVPKPLGSAGGMRKIEEFSGFFDDTTIVLCGDAVIDLDITAAVAEHRAKGALATVITKEVSWDKVESYGVVSSDDSGRITLFQEKPAREIALSNHASTGIYIFEPAALALIPSGIEFDIGSQLFPRMVAQGLPFYAQSRQFDWVDIGTVADYWSVMQLIMAGGVHGMTLPGREIAPGIHCGLNTHIDWEGTTIEGPVYIGSGTHIEAGSRIVGPCWIGSGCRVLAGATLVRSVVFDYTRISRNAQLLEMIVCREHSVDRAGTIAHAGDAHDVWGNARDRRDQRREDQPAAMASVHASALATQ
jgi:mannose-1-phosphate guanylyltransferase